MLAALEADGETRSARLREYHCHSPPKTFKISRVTCSAQAKIMIAKKMGMTIGGTSQAAMVLILRSLMIRLKRRHAY
jgi:type 1 fimbria pilin